MAVCAKVWGGGVYASTDFLDLADEHGIIVTHDFMFGDQFYATNDAFLLDVAAEVRDQAWRMGSHASLGVWCGNNEMANGYDVNHHDFMSAAPFYSRLYFDTIRSNLSDVDPHRAWISSTPSLGNETKAVPYTTSSVELRGDMHFYAKEYLNCWDVSAYPRARFITETGWLSASACSSAVHLILPHAPCHGSKPPFGGQNRPRARGNANTIVATSNALRLTVVLVLVLVLVAGPFLPDDGVDAHTRPIRIQRVCAGVTHATPPRPSRDDPQRRLQLAVARMLSMHISSRCPREQMYGQTSPRKPISPKCLVV